MWRRRSRRPAAIGYEEARELVRAACEPEWKHGTFCLDDREIVEDAEVYVFRVGAREHLLGDDPSYALMGGAIPVVGKADGSLSWVPGHVLYAEHPKLKRRRNPDPTLRA